MQAVSRTSLGLVGALVAIAGCTSPNGSTGSTPAVAALTTGRVTASGGASAGIEVRAYGLASDGTLVAASDVTTTAADGRYALNVTLDADATALVVRCEDGSDRRTLLGRAAVDADIEHDGSITLSPIDLGSTFAAEVSTTLEASENVSVEESTALSLFLSLDAAARLAADADAQGATAACSDAVSSARATFLEGLDASASGSGSSQLALRAIAEAEAELAARLDGCTNDAEVDAAYAAYLDAVIAGCSSAGYSLEAIAAASLEASSALDANVGERVSDGRAELHELSTFAVTTAVDAGVAGMLGSSTIRYASTTLRADIQTLASTGASAEDCARRWTSYTDTVQAEVRARASVSTQVVATLVGDVHDSCDTLTTTWTQVGASASASERVQAFLTYQANVQSGEHVALLTSAGLSDGNAHAVLDAMGDVGVGVSLH